MFILLYANEERKEKYENIMKFRIKMITDIDIPFAWEPLTNVRETVMSIGEKVVKEIENDCTMGYILYLDSIAFWNSERK